MTADRYGAAGSGPRAQGVGVLKRMLRRSALALLPTGIFLLAGGIGSASAQFPSGGVLEEFDYVVTNVKAPAFPGVLYTGGTNATGGGIVDVQSGLLRHAEFLANAWNIFPAGTATLNVEVTDWRIVTSGTITGTASVPPGVSMTVTPEDTGKTTTVPNGNFSIPTGVGGLGAEPPKGGSQVITCRGGARSCQARISLAGGAHNRKVVIRLPDTNLALRSVKAPPRSRHAAYMLTNGKFALGGSEYVVTLNAARSSPRGSQLILTFGSAR